MLTTKSAMAFAAHECAHALIGVLLGWKIKRIVLDANDGGGCAAGRVAFEPTCCGSLEAAVVACAGIALERACDLEADGPLNDSDVSTALDALDAFDDPLLAMVTVVKELTAFFQLAAVRRIVGGLAGDLIASRGRLEKVAVEKRVAATPDWVRKTLDRKFRKLYVQLTSVG